jgi:hypothetical protein
MDKNISNNIVETCKKLGIVYKSCNPNYTEFETDAQELVQIYKDLQTIEDKLARIEEKHKVDGLADIITRFIVELGTIDHEIIRLAEKIKNGN